MKKKYIIALACIIAAALAIIASGYGTVLNTESSTARVVKTSTSLSSFTTPDLDGNQYEYHPSSDLVVYEVFASWCLPCRISVPAAIEFAKSHTDISVVGVAYRDVIPEIEKFQNEYGTFTPTIKTNGKIERILGIRNAPQTLFVKDGTIIYRIYGTSTEADLTRVYSLIKTELATSNDGKNN